MDEFDRIAEELESTGEYRVLKRLKPGLGLRGRAKESARLAVFLDLETTGLDPSIDEIIEIAMVPFYYLDTGEIVEFGQPFQALQEPSLPLPPEITALTGLTESDLNGRSIDWEEVERIISPAVLIVAHNAAFDRPFAEAANKQFVAKAWACSMTEVPWIEEGFEGTRLGYLVMSSGHFFSAHRALDDCYAALELLRTRLPKCGRLAFAELLERARKKAIRVWAIGAPYEKRVTLKARGYRWNSGDNGRPRAWYKDVTPDLYDAERDFLSLELGLADIPVENISAFERFSWRV
jgi:DNA polymerase-3 subunit epsilon